MNRVMIMAAVFGLVACATDESIEERPAQGEVVDRPSDEEEDEGQEQAPEENGDEGTDPEGDTPSFVDEACVAAAREGGAFCDPAAEWNDMPPSWHTYNLCREAARYAECSCYYGERPAELRCEGTCADAEAAWECPGAEGAELAECLAERDAGIHECEVEADCYSSIITPGYAECGRIEDQGYDAYWECMNEVNAAYHACRDGGPTGG